ncbi:MAG: hypothetical protein IJ773_03970 [Lachnospiraceae bacterium]|nr:hypothetical protein [Acidaminococcaceae bacterium]MBQ9284648.1 hypothetical protein [Acidaminococcaceae bacterium]MBR1812959.1 hypothetical protein [Lachnospiraceae bacterium]
MEEKTLIRYQDSRGWLYEIRQTLNYDYCAFYRKPRKNKDLSIGWKRCLQFMPAPDYTKAAVDLVEYAVRHNWERLEPPDEVPW